MKNIFFFFLVLFCGLIIISCSSEDDSLLKDGKVAANLSEADSFYPPYPSLTINDSSAATNQTAVSVIFSGTDAVGITGYIISNQSTVPDLSSSDWVYISSQTQYSVSKDSTVGPSDASYSFYGWMRDGANNISATATSSIVYDTTAPTLSSVSINSGDSTTTNTVVSLTISASDSLSGITAYYASETSSAPSASATGWIDITKTNSLSTTASFTLSSSGVAGSFTKTVYLWVKDAAGNVSSSASDSITAIIADTFAPTNPSASINSGATSTTSSTVSFNISASDDIGVTGYYFSDSPGTPSASASGWTSVTSTTSYSATISVSLTSGSGVYTLYVWFKDASGNVSSGASDSITFLAIPNIYCGLINSSTGGTSALSATKLTSGSTRTTTLSSSSSNYYFFFGASSSSTYTITWSGNAFSYTIYKGAGNKYEISYVDDDSTTISNYTGDVIIKFDPSSSNQTVAFSITGGTIQDYHSDKNSNCQTSVSLGTNSLSPTSITTGRIYKATLSSSSTEYYAKFSASSSKSYTIIWSGNAFSYTIYKGAGNQYEISYVDDYSTTISSYSGDVIIKFDPSSSNRTVDFMVYEE